MAFIALFTAAWHCFPFPTEKLERRPASPMITARDGTTLLTVVGTDEQWRYPVTLDEISPWLIQATKAVEDERFDTHHGVDPIAVVRALGQNISSGRVVSGASTITMQICRMTDDRPRTLRAKIIESFRALQLERTCDKDTILDTYLNIAPYGGNIRGVEAASLIYFNRHARDLSLGQAALLAGLPQSPTRHRPDLHADRAATRRSTVLHRMVELGMITPDQQNEAEREPVHLASPPRESIAPHAAWMALDRRPDGGQTTIDPALQKEVNRLVADHHRTLPEGSDIAVVIIDATSSEIVALVGSARYDDPLDGQVNGALARRSPGSALKPFIYATAMQAGLINADTIVHDEPIERAGWTPTNFDHHFRGPLPAAEALRQSLNIPAILVAEAAGLARCAGTIEAAGVDLPDDAVQRGGLAVVVGAVEVTLLDLTNAYATLARQGHRTDPRLFSASPRPRVPASLTDMQSPHPGADPLSPHRTLPPDTCALISHILSTDHRLPHGLDDRAPQTIPWFMWKTGTSSGRRDAWAAGHNTRFAAGVWVGRFNNVGHHTYVGAESAEPLLARLMTLPQLTAQSRPPSEPTTEVVGHPSEPVTVATGRPSEPVTEVTGRNANAHGPARTPTPHSPPNSQPSAQQRADSRELPHQNPPRKWRASPPNLPAPRELPMPDNTATLRILHPRPDTTLHTLHDRVTITPRATPPGNLTWFLDGHLLDPAAAQRLHLPPGTHTLLCTNPNGQTANATFHVR